MFVNSRVNPKMVLFTNFVNFFCRSVVVPPKKSTGSSSAATTNLPTHAVSVVSSLDSAQAPDLTKESPGESE